MKLAVRNIEENSLLTIPAEIGADKIKQPQDGGIPFLVAETAGHAFGMDGFSACVDMPVGGIGVDVFYTALFIFFRHICSLFCMAKSLISPLGLVRSSGIICSSIIA